MEYQQDSIDISQLKAVALGLHDAPVTERTNPSLSQTRAPLHTPSSLHSLQTRATNVTSQSAKLLKSPKFRDAVVPSIVEPLQHVRNIAQLEKCNPTQTRGRDAASLWPSRTGVSSTMSVVSSRQMHSNGTPSDGDTQPASQWVYDDKELGSTKSMVPHVQEEGETGHINLVDGFEQDFGAGEDSTMSVDEDEEDDVELVSQDIRAEPFPDSRRFQPPMTPLTNGTKRKRPVQEETPQFQTLMLPTNPFAGLGASDVMRPSQIFQATQAQTSPQIAHSDGLYERPSPNMDNFGRPSTACSHSSPAIARVPRPSTIHAVTEPQATYISMKESQEARERRLQEMRTGQDNLSDDEFGPPSHSQLQEGLRQDNRAKGPEIQYARKGLPTTSTQQLKTKGKTFSQSSHTTGRSGRGLKENFWISDDPLAEGDRGNITEDETEREEEDEEKAHDDEIDELAEENKENVEVPMTISRLHHAQVITSQTSPSRSHVRRRLKTPGSQPATQVEGSPRRTASPLGDPSLGSGTQTYAVRDSQSSLQHNTKERPGASASSRPQSSLESRNVVFQSQLSQNSKSPVSQSSIPGQAAAIDVLGQPTSSSPPQLNDFSARPPRICNIQRNGPVHLEARENERIGAAGNIMDRSDRQVPAERHSFQAESNGIRSQISKVSTIIDTTKPDSSLMARGTATVRSVVPNSSQDMSSSGQIPSSMSKIATNQSSDGQSLGTTLYETAQDHLSISPSKNHVQRLQDRSLRSNASSPTKNLRRRTLGQIAADPSPPDPVEDVSLSDFGLLNKEDDDFHKIVLGPVHLEPNAREQRANTSTKWKTFGSDPHSECQGTPARPTSSAISAPTPVQLSFEREPRSSSPLSSPPASQRERPPLSAGSKDVKERSSPRVEPSTDAPASSAQSPPAASLVIKPSATEASTRVTSKSIPGEEQPLRKEQTKNRQSKALKAVSKDASNLPVIAPDRVFAHFNGKPSAFYSATCLGVIRGDEPRYSVHYDDGAEDSISASGIKRLEFRPGDVVKVDLPAHRTKNYIVVGMQDKQEVEDPDTLARRRKTNPNDKEAWPDTDIYGHTKILLSLKQSNPAGGKQTEEEVIAMGIYHLYFTQAMWTNIKDRDYAHVDRRLKVLEGLQTPADRPSTPSSPSSRARRLKSTSLIQAKSTSGPKQGLFSRMVFTLTNIYPPTDLERAKSLILTHGGKVLEEGFDPLFHIPVLHRITSPKKSDSDRSFHITGQAQDLGFTCLIADKHCRRAKYIQALALGIPCIATRWISDCVSKQRVLPWSIYLLPAGESTFLGGAIRSRVLPSLSAETATLSKLVEQQTRMLDGASILLIMSKNDEANMRQHPLLIFALGPARVVRALSIEAATKAVAEAQAVGKPWDWVFSYDREREVERILFGSAAKKRRSRAGDGGQEVRTRVIGNEFLIQSLIMGQLLGE